MLIPRVMPCLCLDDGRFVKTRAFSDPVFLGDPVNIIDLFNRFEVDEIILVDIRASLHRREPDFSLISDLASECWVPLSYGGGLTNLAQVERAFQSGVEKVIINSAIAKNGKPDAQLIREVSRCFGSQALVVSIDVRKTGLLGKHVGVSFRSGTQTINMHPTELAKQAEEWGAGEILLHDVEREGTRLGFDLNLISSVANSVSIPVIACGGANSREELAAPILQAGASAVAASSVFVFQKGRDSVLINFPERPALEALFQARNGFPEVLARVEPR